MLRTILGGCVVVLLGCGGSPVLQCRVDAVSRLPLRALEDPDTLTVGDVRGLARELKACRDTADGGAQ